MTRLLSQLLGAREPDFQLQLQQFERTSGHPEVDIHLSTKLTARVRAKIRDLGLDPEDTTGPELYQAVSQRLLADEQRLRQTLGLNAQATMVEVLNAVQQFVTKTDIPKTCFALKTSVAKRLLQAQAPKKAMKALGYRSLPSLLKHEPVVALYAATLLYESPQWHADFVEQYKQLTPSDFEVRNIKLLFPKARRWEPVAREFAAQHHHVSIAFKELGAIVVLPVTVTMPAAALTSVLLLFDEINTIRCASTFLKLQQVRPQFGESVKHITTAEPNVSTVLTAWSGHSLPWQTLQYYYHKVREAYHPVLFEPHVQPEDLALVEAEETLAKVVPALAFWQDTADLALLHRKQTVSLNMLDVALNVSNELAFESRVVGHVRSRLSAELITHYLSHHRAHQQLASLDESVIPSTVVMEEATI